MQLPKQVDSGRIKDLNALFHLDIYAMQVATNTTMRLTAIGSSIYRNFDLDIRLLHLEIRSLMVTAWLMLSQLLVLPWKQHSIYVAFTQLPINDGKRNPTAW